MTKEEQKILEGIMKVATEVTDFDVEFDWLFGFMAENPESQTTKDFIDFHITEMNSPKLENGEPTFTYLIGKEFIHNHWVNIEDMPAFRAYLKKQNQ